MKLLFERLNYLKSFEKFNFLTFIEPNYSEIVDIINLLEDHPVTAKN